VCNAPDNLCANGQCIKPPCVVAGGACSAAEFCCSSTCCLHNQLCCEVPGPVATLPQCYTPTAQQPTCPVGACGGNMCASDRNLKHDIEPVDAQSVLERVSQLPISTWSYKSDNPSVRHMGMMAQDFHAQFGLGDTDRAFNPIDAHGVEMAAIKALYQRVLEQEERIRQLEQERATAPRCGP
jgi:hypothetical protein